jgi:GNAT superfamily N-acetyltransferase
MIVFGSGGDHWLGRMFVDPDLQNRGIGSEAMELLERELPDATRWTLETPPWNRRNHSFYRKAGYSRTGVSGSADLLFEKNMKTPSDSP